MFNIIAVNLVLSLHLTFILFVVFGGLLVLKWRWLVWLHLPAVAWGVFISFSGWICPLTILENMLLVRSGGEGYSGEFIAHLIYPPGLTREMQMVMGLVVILVNLVAYAVFFVKRGRGRGKDV